MGPNSPLPPFRRLSSRRLTPSVEVHFCTINTLLPYDRERWLSASPTQYSAQAKYDRLRQDRLLWHVSANFGREALPLAVMRNHLARKWKDALRKALLLNGYDFHGRRPPVAPGKRTSEGLKGTANIVIRHAYGLKESPETLLQQADLVIKLLMEKMPTNKNDEAG